MTSSQRIDGGARPGVVVRQINKFANVGHWKTEITGAANESQPGDLGWSIVPIVRSRTWRSRENALSLVEADRLRLDAGFPRDLTNSHIVSPNRLTL